MKIQKLITVVADNVANLGSVVVKIYIWLTAGSCCNEEVEIRPTKQTISWRNIKMLSVYVRSNRCADVTVVIVIMLGKRRLTINRFVVGSFCDQQNMDFYTWIGNDIVIIGVVRIEGDMWI